MFIKRQHHIVEDIVEDNMMKISKKSEPSKKHYLT